MKDVSRMVPDSLMAGVIDSGKRRKGWMTSADVFDRDKLREIGSAGAKEMTRLVAAHNATRSINAHAHAHAPAVGAPPPSDDPEGE
jgi:hypothetical protein